MGNTSAQPQPPDPDTEDEDEMQIDEEEEDGYKNVTYQDLMTSWRDNFLDNAMERVANSGDGLNGLFHSFENSVDTEDGNGAVVPEEIMEIILSYCSPRDILSISLVCVRWKTITTARSFWKLVYRRRNICWNKIPSGIKENPHGWIAFSAFCNYGLLSRNFVLNHSGQDGFNRWELAGPYNYHNDQPFQIEQTPIGCDPLPDDPFFNSTCCFATTFTYGNKGQRVDLWRAGLTSAVMKICAPFEFTFSEMVGVRFDCGGMGGLFVNYEENGKGQGPVSVPDSVKSEEFSIPSGNNWKTFNIAMQPVDSKFLEKYALRYVFVRSSGKDTQFWAGYYGAKFARSCLRFRCLESLETAAAPNTEDSQPDEKKNN